MKELERIAAEIGFDDDIVDSARDAADNAAKELGITDRFSREVLAKYYLMREASKPLQTIAGQCNQLIADMKHQVAASAQSMDSLTAAMAAICDHPAVRALPELSSHIATVGIHLSRR